MKFIKWTLIVLAILGAITVILGLIAPKDFDTKRSIVVNAPVEAVYKNMSTFEGFKKWEPFSKWDSTQTSKVEGSDGTVGAMYSWEGKKNGKGTMTTAKLETNKAVDYDMVFYTPMGEMKNVAYMTTEPAEGGQKVTWGIKGHSSFMGSIMGLFMPMEKMMGPTFEEGLKTFKDVTEAEGSGTSYTVEEIQWEAKNCLATPKKKVTMQEIGPFFGENFGKIAATIAKAGAKPGIPLGIYYNWDDATMSGEMAAAIPYDVKKNFGKEFNDITLPASKAYKVDYYGWYGGMKPAYDALTTAITSAGYSHPELSIEEYVNDLESVKDTAKLHTVIYFIVNQPMAAK